MLVARWSCDRLLPKPLERLQPETGGQRQERCPRQRQIRHASRRWRFEAFGLVAEGRSLVAPTRRQSSFLPPPRFQAMLVYARLAGEVRRREPLSPKLHCALRRPLALTVRCLVVLTARVKELKGRRPEMCLRRSCPQLLWLQCRQCLLLLLKYHCLGSRPMSGLSLIHI